MKSNNKKTYMNFIIQILNDIVKIGNESISKLNGKDFSIAWDLFLADLLVRYNLCIASTTLLLKEFGNSNTGRYSIMTVLRSATLDYIILTYLFTFYKKYCISGSEEDQKYFNNKIYGFLADQLRHQIKDYKLMYDHKLITEEEYIKSIKQLARNNNILMNIDEIDIKLEPLKSIIHKRPPSTEQMFKHIFSDNMTNDASQLYLHYATFSKVEHYGILSRDLMQNVTLMPIFLHTLKYIIHGHYLCHNLINEEYELKQNAKHISNLGLDFGELIEKI